MIGSRLIEILRVFNKKEIRDLRKWLSSPAHNQREDVIILYQFMTEKDRFLQDSEITKNQVFKAVYDTNTYDDAKMRQLIFFTMSAVEEFIAYQQFRNNSVRRNLSLAAFYRNRKLNRHYQKTIKNTKSIQDKLGYQNNSFLNLNFLLQQEISNSLSQEKRTDDANLGNTLDALDKTYIADKLLLACSHISRKAVFNTDYQLRFIDKIIDTVQQEESLLNTPAIAVYLYAYLANTNHDNEHYFKNLKTEIIKNGQFFQKAELTDIYVMAFNFCIKKINAGFSSFLREYFELYKEGLQIGIFIDNNRMSSFTFTNVITTALRLNELEWVDNFIRENQIYLSQTHRDSIINYNLGRLYFEKGNYDKSMELLNKVDYDDILINLNTKTILIKIFYYRNEQSVLESLLESMRNYLVRKKVIGYHKANYKHIIKFTKKLVHVNPYSTVEKEKLKKAIEEANPLTERAWLLQQLEQL